MYLKQVETRSQMSFFAYTLPAHVSDPGGQKELHIAKALKEIITEAFALYAEMKCLYWYFTRNGGHNEHQGFNAQAMLLSAIIDRLLKRVRHLSSTAIDTCQKKRPWRLIATDRDDDLLAMEIVQQLIKDHERLIKLIRGARAVCERHQDAQTHQILSEALIETTDCITALVEVYDQLHVGARTVEQASSHKNLWAPIALPFLYCGQVI